MAKKFIAKKQTDVVIPTNLKIEQSGTTKAIHAKLSDNVKTAVDAMSKEMNVPQWVIINSLCKQALDSLSK